jgi:predicted acylesterase/phospholipase RssA
MYAAWEVGVWKALAPHIHLDLIVGASAGALNGWAIAGGATPEDLVGVWLDQSLAAIRVFHAEPLRHEARALVSRFQPQIPFGLTIVEARRMRVRLVRESEVTWQHLTATCSIPFLFPPVVIDGRSYVDGGLLGALPVWAAEEMGATRAIAVNCLHGLPFRMLRAVLRPREPSGTCQVVTIQPSERLGSLRSALVWSRPTVERWISLGERDGKAALPLIANTSVSPETPAGAD